MAYVGRGINNISNASILDDITFTDSAGPYNLTQNSGADAFTPISAQALVISVDGVIQDPTTYTLSAATITFDSVMASTSTNDFIVHNGVGIAYTPSDNTVTVAKLVLPFPSLTTDWESKSNDFTAAAGKGYFCDTTSNDIDVTLPSPTIGDTIRFLDATGTFDTYDLTILYGSSKIQGVSANLDVSTERAGFALVYYNAAQGWLLLDK